MRKADRKPPKTRIRNPVLHFGLGASGLGIHFGSARGVYTVPYKYKGDSQQKVPYAIVHHSQEHSGIA